MIYAFFVAGSICRNLRAFGGTNQTINFAALILLSYSDTTKQSKIIPGYALKFIAALVGGV